MKFSVWINGPIRTLSCCLMTRVQRGPLRLKSDWMGQVCLSGPAAPCFRFQPIREALTVGHASCWPLWLHCAAFRSEKDCQTLQILHHHHHHHFVFGKYQKLIMIHSFPAASFLSGNWFSLFSLLDLNAALQSGGSQKDENPAAGERNTGFPCVSALHSDWLTTEASLEQLVPTAVHRGNRNQNTITLELQVSAFFLS